jgi:hypothetical protein
MKTIYSTILSASFLFIMSFTAPSSSLNSGNTEICIATYDGAEGDYFFFTDENDKAIQFESINAIVIQNHELINGSDIDKVFKVEYEGSKILNLEIVK